MPNEPSGLTKIPDRNAAVQLDDLCTASARANAGVGILRSTMLLLVSFIVGVLLSDGVVGAAPPLRADYR